MIALLALDFAVILFCAGTFIKERHDDGH